jgi:LuxR family maltose regulon positive regulatory protein
MRMTVTLAEQRVLQLLTTHPTLGEIAEQLHTSRNTVKAHAISVYRKLNASTRTDAVREARASACCHRRRPQHPIPVRD